MASASRLLAQDAPGDVWPKLFAADGATRGALYGWAALSRNLLHQVGPLRHHDGAYIEVAGEPRGASAFLIDIGSEIHVEHLSAPLKLMQDLPLRHELSALLSNRGMHTIDEVRRRRLQMLIEEFGSMTALNDRLNINRRDSTLSQIANQSLNSRTGTPKQMGSALARDLEKACGKETGWMDNDPDLWPFVSIDQAKILALSERNRTLLEGAILSMATTLGVDLEKRRAA